MHCHQFKVSLSSSVILSLCICLSFIYSQRCGCRGEGSVDYCFLLNNICTPVKSVCACVYLCACVHRWSAFVTGEGSKDQSRITRETRAGERELRGERDGQKRGKGETQVENKHIRLAVRMTGCSKGGEKYI